MRPDIWMSSTNYVMPELHNQATWRKLNRAHLLFVITHAMLVSLSPTDSQA